MIIIETLIQGIILGTAITAALDTLIRRMRK